MEFYNTDEAINICLNSEENREKIDNSRFLLELEEFINNSIPQLLEMYNNYKIMNPKHYNFKNNMLKVMQNLDNMKMEETELNEENIRQYFEASHAGHVRKILDTFYRYIDWMD